MFITINQVNRAKTMFQKEKIAKIELQDLHPSSDKSVVHFDIHGENCHLASFYLPSGEAQELLGYIRSPNYMGDGVSFNAVNVDTFKY